jgi:hypothetical protein
VNNFSRRQNTPSIAENNGGRAGTRTPDLLRVNSTVIAHIADSYGGLAPFVRRVRVCPALIAQLSEQLSGGRALVLPEFAGLVRVPLGTRLDQHPVTDVHGVG